MKIQEGDWVRLHRGARVKTNHPDRGPMYEVQRAKSVRVHEITDAEVTWIGSAGYECTVKLDFVSFVKRPRKM